MVVLITNAKQNGIEINFGSKMFFILYFCVNEGDKIKLNSLLPTLRIDNTQKLANL